MSPRPIVQDALWGYSDMLQFSENDRYNDRRLKCCSEGLSDSVDLVHIKGTELCQLLDLHGTVLRMHFLSRAHLKWPRPQVWDITEVHYGIG